MFDKVALRTNVPWRHLVVKGYDDDSMVFFCSDETGKEKHLGAAFIGQPLIGADASTVDKLRTAISFPLPAGSYIQIGLMSTLDIDAYPDAYLYNKKTGSSLLATMTRERAEFIRSGRDEPLIKRSGCLLNTKRVVVTIKIPIGGGLPTNDQIEDAKTAAERLHESTKSAGIELDQLDVSGYLEIMRRITNMYAGAESWYDESRPISDQVFMPGDCIEDRVNSLVINDSIHCKMMSVKWFPKTASLAVMNYLIGEPSGVANQFELPFVVMLTIHYPDQVEKVASMRQKHAMITHQAIGQMARFIPSLGYKKEGFDMIVNEIDGSGAVLVEMNLTVMVFSRDLKAVDRQVAAMTAYYSSLGFDMREEKRILWPLWNTVLPMNTTQRGAANLFRFHTMSANQAVQFMPIFGDWNGTGNGGACLFVSRRGEPQLVDLYDSPTNFNAVVIAESGSGKSFLTQQIISDYLAEGSKIWTIDVGRSYLKLAKAMGGEFIEFSENSQVCLNPFTHVEDIDEEMDLLKAILIKMAAPESGFDDFRSAVLEEAIKSVWSHYGNRMSISEVAEWCLSQVDDRMRDIGRQLYPFTRLGSYGAWFDGENNLRFDKDFVVLELEELKSRKTMQQVVLLQLISKVNNEMFLAQKEQKGRKKLLVLDEAWSLLDDPVMAKAMENAYRRARKYDAGVIVVTQSIADLFTSPNAQAIYQNAAFQFILQQRTEAIDAAVSSGQLSMSGYGVATLKGVHTIPGKYSEFMIRRGDNNWGISRLVTDHFSQVLYSTKGKERDDIFSAIENGEDAVDAIDRFIQQNG